MDVTLSVGRVLLAMVFALAAAGKLIDLPGTRRALVDFGAARRQAGVGAVLLPAAELGIAIALLPRPSARWGAVAAAALLATFIVAIARVLRQGRSPDCHCFGQIHSAPATTRTLVRNLALIAIAAFVAAAGPGKAIDSQLSTLDATAWALLGACVLSAALAVTNLWLWQQRGQLKDQVRRAGARPALPATVPVGSPAPEFQLHDERDQPAGLNDLLARGRPLILVFTSPQCGPCRAMLPDLARWQRALAHQLSIIPVSCGELTDSRALVAEHGLSPALIAPNLNISETYGVPATPAAVVVNPDGRVASQPATGAPAVEALIRVTVHRQHTGQPATSPAPTQKGEGVAWAPERSSRCLTGLAGIGLVFVRYFRVLSGLLA